MLRKTVLGLLFATVSLGQAIGIDLGIEKKVSASVEYRQPSFIIKSLNMIEPLRLGSESSQIFFGTAAGKTFLTGTPAITGNSDNLTAIWSIDGRQVAVEFVRQHNSYKISFRSSPCNDIIIWGFSLSATANEYFTGLMEQTVNGKQSLSWQAGIKEAMDLRGQIFEMLTKPTLGLYCPFYVSSNNYSLFTEGTWPGVYDFCKSDANCVQISFEGKSLAVVLNTGKPAELIKQHSLKTGPAILPPKWTFGPWKWRDEHKNLETYYDGTKVTAPYNSQLVEDILMMQAYDVPCSVYLIDRPWAVGKNGFSDYDWNSERFPQAVNMISWMKKRDINTVLWIAPWVMGNMYTEAMEKKYNLDGQLGHQDDRAKIDFSNPKAVKWLQEKGLTKVLKQGIKGFKLDRSEEVTPYDYEHKAFDGRLSREYHNDFPVMYARTVNQACKKIHGDDFVILPRAGYTGSSKYATFWGGDTGSSNKNATVPEALRCAIISFQRASVLGFGLWGSDTGGYTTILDHEVAARWLAFSCFTPIMEVGPTENSGFWDLKIEPKYDPQLIATWRLYTKLHSKLQDYTFACSKELSSTGMPIGRPLFMVCPQSKEAWLDWQTYMYGPDILVSMIWQKGQTQQKLYLPDGEKWVDAWDKKVYDGGQSITVDTPVYKIPIFIRQGAKVDLGDLNALYQESLRIAEQKPDLDKLQKEAFIK